MDYIAAVNTDPSEGLVGEIQYGGSSGSGYDVEPGLSETQVRRVYEGLDEVPDPRTEKDDGAGNLIAKTQAEIDAYDAADPVLVKEGKRDAAIARGQASLDQPVTASDLFDILGIE